VHGAPPSFIDKEADAAEALAEAYRPDFVVALLGPAGEPYVSWRVHAQKILLDHAYKALVMETYPAGAKGETEPLRGAHIEFGYLLREYGVREILDRVRFFIENGTDESKALAGYETDLIGLVGLDWFKDSDQLARRMARRIDNILYGLKR
jgi:hypothetical protein